MLKRFNSATLFCLVVALGLSATLAAAPSPNVRVNSVGYIAAQPKRATVLTAAGTNAFNVRRVADNVSVFSGTLGGVVNNTDTGQNVRFADFGAVTTAGAYYLDVTGVGTSANFNIGDDVFNNALWTTVMGFYNQRCGVATSMSVGGNTWAHGACHLGDGNLTHYSGSNTTKNGTGGWHDAGDFGKYIVNAGITVGQMLQAWELYSGELQSLTLPHGSNPALPDYLEEIKWEMDWVLKMQFPDGRVSHKLTRTGFENYPLMPEADGFTRYFTPYTSAATASFVAICAKAARSFQPYDAAYAATLQAAANLSYAYLVANPAETTYGDWNGGITTDTGAYSASDSDDRLWAAVEMWESTGLAAQLTDAENRINAHGTDKSDLNWDWGDVSNLGMYTYALSTRNGRNAAILADVRNDIVADANAMVTAANNHGYGRALNAHGTPYYWGANGTVVRLAHHLDIANRIAPNAAFLDAAGQQLAWAFSRNYFNRSQVTGLGLNPPLAPHDRESSGDGVAPPKPGHLVGGGHPNATSWVDDEGDYAQNEIAINWDGALTYALAMWYKGPAVGTPTATQTITPTFSPSPTLTPLPCGPGGTLRRVNVGGTAFVDGATNNWSADQAYAGGGWGYVAAGTTSSTAPGIAGTTDDALYQNQRWAGTLNYRFTVPNGAYNVTVLMAETYWTATGQRIFNVTAEGATVLSGVDIFTLAPGANRAYQASFGVGVADGILDLSFIATTDNASVAGIRIDSVTSGPCSTETSTPTSTRSRTPTNTASPSPSVTASPTATRTATPSATPSRTASATRTASPTPSHTPSVTLTHTASPLASDTVSPTVSATFSASPTLSRTATPSRTSTPSTTPTLSVTVTITLSHTASPLASDTVSPTVSPSSTRTPSATPSATALDTATFSATATPLDTATTVETATPTSTRTPTPTFSATPSPGGGLTPVPTTPAVTPAHGHPEVQKASPVPQPQQGGPLSLAVFIRGGQADAIELHLYSRAYVCVGIYQLSGSFPSGWNGPLRFQTPDLANGTYFVRLRASAQGSWSKLSRPAPLVVIK